MSPSENVVNEHRLGGKTRSAVPVYQKAREACAIQAVIQGEKAESALERMSPIKKSARIRRGIPIRYFTKTCVSDSRLVSRHCLDRRDSLT